MRTNTLQIIQDYSPESPREWCNIGTIMYTSNRYTLGDEYASDLNHWLQEKLVESGYEDRAMKQAEEAGTEYQSPDELTMQELQKEFDDYYFHRAVYAYIHSGTALSLSPFSCPWDSGQSGIIYVKKDYAESEGITQEQVFENFKAEIDTFNQYLNGDVYGFKVVDTDGEEVDSCGGFYGSDYKTNGMACHIDMDTIKKVVMMEDRQVSMSVEGEVLDEF